MPDKVAFFERRRVRVFSLVGNSNLHSNLLQAKILLALSASSISNSPGLVMRLDPQHVTFDQMWFRTETMDNTDHLLAGQQISMAISRR